MATQKRGIHTQSVHAGVEPDPQYGAVSVPIFQSSTFAFASADQGAARFRGDEDGYIYSRMGNPTTAALEQAVASLEGGHAGLATSSGMAAIFTVFFTYLEAGAHIIGTDSVYGPSRVAVEKHFRRFGVQSTFVDTSDVENIRAAIRPETRMLYIETPENPTIRLTDIRACAAIAREHELLLVVDNTFASPVLQRPLELGADIVVHSMTKFLNGHADVVAGIIVSSTEHQRASLRDVLNHHGGCIDPHQAWLVHRGIKTLGLRVIQAQRNAQAVSQMLHEHPAVEWVRYPGAPDHPQRELVERQMDGPGSLLCFGVRGGLDSGKLLMERVEVATLAVSLGGVETLIEHPASMTHAGLSQKVRDQSGITDNLIRLAVGCEDADDIVDDLRRALDSLSESVAPEAKVTAADPEIHG
ncbi:MAG TPA: PLP-dependent aspartate aminotransferase family protein [Longimicrobiales bacterium]|nr:PLP-dependent aspartate aminotransferase family protein [Longimicrobiales bacterium]